MNLLSILEEVLLLKKLNDFYVSKLIEPFVHTDSLYACAAGGHRINSSLLVRVHS